MRRANFFFNNMLGRVRMRSNMPKQAHTVIIGGGLAGISTLYYLLLNGIDAVLVESGDVGFRASGRSVGFAGLPNLHTMSDKPSAVYELIKNNNKLIQEVCSKEKISCDMDYSGEIHVSSSILKTSKHKIPNVTRFNRDELKILTSSDKFYNGVFFPIGMSTHTYGLINGITAACEYCGAYIYSNMPVSSIKKTGGGYRVKNKYGQNLDCTSVVLCTPLLLNKFADGKTLFANIKKRKLYGACTRQLSLIETYPLPSYNLFLIDENVRLRVYCNRIFIEYTNKLSEKEIVDFINKYFGIKVRMDYMWSDDIYDTNKLLYTSELIDENVYVNTGYGRYGLSTCFTVSKMIAAAICADTEQGIK